jgi:hypothetical protein
MAGRPSIFRPDTDPDGSSIFRASSGGAPSLFRANSGGSPSIFRRPPDEVLYSDIDSVPDVDNLADVDTLLDQS